VNVSVIAIPYDTGRRGVRSGRGPGALLQAGLVDALADAGHSATVATIDVPDGPLEPEPRVALGIWERLAEAVRSAASNGAMPVVLTGSCYAAVGVVAGLAPEARAVCWFDAHADCNTPDTTTTGFLDGMAVSLMIGRCWRRLTEAVSGFRPVEEEGVVLIGVRDVDPPERKSMEEMRVLAFAPGKDSRLGDALSLLGKDRRGAYLHVDLDVLDPSVGIVNHLSTAAGPGLSLETLLQHIRTVGAAIPIRAVTLSAYAPEYDREGKVPAAAFAVLREALAAVRSC
jgi:arginase